MLRINGGLAFAAVLVIGSAVLLLPAGGGGHRADHSAQTPPDAPQKGGAAAKAGDSLPVKDISLEQAQAVLQAAIKKAQELKINEDIAVVDAGGSLKAFARMDNAWLGSIDIAQKKARTSRLFDMPSGELGKKSQPGGPLYNIEFSNHGLITFPGGVPLRDSSDAIIGAVGASGSTVQNDDAVARAAAEVVKK